MKRCVFWIRSGKGKYLSYAPKLAGPIIQCCEGDIGGEIGLVESCRLLPVVPPIAGEEARIQGSGI